MCREKYMDDLVDVVKKIKNDLRMSNWVQLSTGGSDVEAWYTDFDAMKKQIDDHGNALSDNVGVARVV